MPQERGSAVAGQGLAVQNRAAHVDGGYRSSGEGGRSGRRPSPARVRAIGPNTNVSGPVGPGSGSGSGTVVGEVVGGAVVGAEAGTVVDTGVSPPGPGGGNGPSPPPWYANASGTTTDPPGVETWTSTVAANARAGVVASTTSDPTTVTLVAATPPKSTWVLVENPAPSIQTRVPPANGPLRGDRFVTARSPSRTGRTGAGEGVVVEGVDGPSDAGPVVGVVGLGPALGGTVVEAGGTGRGADDVGVVRRGDPG